MLFLSLTPAERRSPKFLARLRSRLGLLFAGLVLTGNAWAIIEPCSLVGNVTFSPLHPGASDVISYRVSIPATLTDHAPDTRILAGPPTMTGGRIEIDVVITSDPAAFPTYSPVSVKYAVDSEFGSVGPLAAGSYPVLTSVRGKDTSTGSYVDYCQPKLSSLLVNYQPAATNALPVVEFYNSSLDHYFITQSVGEIADLDSGMHAGWQRTGQSFMAYVPGESDGRGRPTCRWYGLPIAGLDTHFISASLVECNAIATDPFTRGRWQLESYDVLESALPDTTSGVCRDGANPVYRLWNGRADSNHRYTTSRATRDQMIAKGYVAEGFGPEGVAMCANPSP